MRKPDVVIGDTYVRRWYVIPHNKWFNIYLHHFLKDDSDRCLHDHPWWSVSFMFRGNLSEKYFKRGKDVWRKIIWMVPYIRPAKHRHSLYLDSDEAWTIFITGPEIREWGFWPEDDKWVPWSEFLAEGVIKK